MNNIPNILKESNFNQQKIQNLFTDSNLDVNSDDFGVLNFSQNEVTDESSLYFQSPNSGSQYRDFLLLLFF